MADAEHYRRFFQPSPAQPWNDVSAAEEAFAATPTLPGPDVPPGLERGWAHVALPVGVLHPALLDVAAEAYGVSVDEVREAADSGGLEGGPLVRRVPVASSSLQPPERGFGGRLIATAVDARLGQLLRHARVVGHLIDSAEEQWLIDGAAGALQRAFVSLVRQVVDGGTLWTPAPDERERLRPAGAPGATDGDWADPPNPLRPTGCAIAGERLLLVYPYAVVLLDRLGRVHAVEAATDLRLSYASDGLARFARGGRGYAWSLADGRWLNDWPAQTSALFVEERQEQTWLVDAVAGRVRELWEVVDHPRVARAAPDGRYVWVEDAEESGGIFDVERGLRQLSPHELRLPPSDEAAWERRADSRFAPDYALAFTADERLRLFIIDLLHADGVAHRLPGADAAGFSGDAGELLCADREQLRLYALGEGPPALGLSLDLELLAPLLDHASRGVPLGALPPALPRR